MTTGGESHRTDEEEEDGAASGDAGGAGAGQGAAAADVSKLFEAARRLFKDGDASAAFVTLKHAFARDAGFARLYPLAAEVADSLGFSPESRLFRRLAKAPRDPYLFFGLGMHFFRQNDAELALPFFRQALTLNPPDEDLVFQAIRHLGYANQGAGRFDEAVVHLEKLVAAERDDRGDLLSLAECLIAERRAARAEEILARLDGRGPGDEEEADRSGELGRMLDRLREFPEDGDLGLREWHYVQHRGVLLDLFQDPRPAGGRFVAVWLTVPMVARVLVAARELLRDRGLAIRRVLRAGERAGPLAGAFAGMLGVSCIRWEERASAPPTEGAGADLVVATHSEDLGPMCEQLYPVDGGLVLYAHCLQWTYDQPVLPELCGLMAQMAKMPWEDRLRVAEESDGGRKVVKLPPDARAAEEIAAGLLAEIGKTEVGDATRELVAAYRARKDLLLGSRRPGDRRRMFFAASPIGGVRFG
ncbi:MAG: tetratricopeptide repeat protein [Planctomycetes bacterium]|nr:tetratricopeptide repeat protein [Planctomycetota bacterium]